MSSVEDVTFPLDFLKHSWEYRKDLAIFASDNYDKDEIRRNKRNFV